MNIDFFVILIIISVLGFLFDLYLDYLNTTRWSNTLPSELVGIYDAEKYTKQQNYTKVKYKFGLFTSTISFIVVMLMLIFQGFGLLDNFIRQFTDNSIFIALIFFGALSLAADILGTPLSAYSTFVIEEKFGFNKTNIKTFILDKLKGWLLAFIIGGGLISLVIWIYETTGGFFWLYVWAVITVFSLFMTMFYSEIIVPIFNKQTPLEKGELRDAIEAFSEKVGFKLKNIFVINGSKRSSKANAYFSGLGPKKRIVLYDTLINDHTTDELVAILAHEIGHYKKKHTLLGFFLSIFQTGLMLFILSFFITKGSVISGLLSDALGAKIDSFHIGIIAFGILYSPLSIILGIAGSFISRKNEYSADEFAAKKYSSIALQNALKKLSVNNLSNLTPHPAYVFFHYTHPPLLKRLDALKRIKNEG